MKEFGKSIAIILILLISVSWVQKKKSLSILMIGDSNTEIGNITMALKTLLNKQYGDDGTGYCTFNPSSMGRVPDSLSVKCDSNWHLFDMRNDFKPEQPPYYSPNGLSISSSIKGAVATLNFTGNEIDVYFLQQNLPGSFSIAIDGVEKKIVKSKALEYATKKVSINHLALHSHQLTITVVSGSVTLLGIDARKGNKKNKNRFVLHKWGNAWASTQDFVNINRNVFSTSLQQLNPNKIVILLGTNDHNLDHRNAEDVKNNLKELVIRIKESLPNAEVLVVSTFNCDGEEAKNILPEYVAKSFPQAAKETNVSYWDMNKWFGPYSPEKLQDGVHVNEEYGKQIAAEILRLLK